jgi:alkylhydroperoxidase/carboxymuconolactone decarboxylase family protein YurZ
MTISVNQPSAGDARNRKEWKGKRPLQLLRMADKHPLIGKTILPEGPIVMRSLDHHTRELVAVGVGAGRESAYVWSGHVYVALGLDALTRDEIVRVAMGPTYFSGRDAAVLWVVEHTLARRPVDAGTRKQLGRRTVKRIVRAVMFYDAITFLMRDVGPEPDLEPVKGIETPARARGTYADRVS